MLNRQTDICFIYVLSPHKEVSQSPPASLQQLWLSLISFHFIPFFSFLYVCMCLGVDRNLYFLGRTNKKIYIYILFCYCVGEMSKSSSVLLLVFFLFFLLGPVHVVDGTDEFACSCCCYILHILFMVVCCFLYLLFLLPLSPFILIIFGGSSIIWRILLLLLLLYGFFAKIHVAICESIYTTTCFRLVMLLLLLSSIFGLLAAPSPWGHSYRFLGKWLAIKWGHRKKLVEGKHIFIYSYFFRK